MEISKDEQNILYTIVYYHPNLFEAMLDTWPTLATQALSFDWDYQWSDNISDVLFERLQNVHYWLIAIRHGLDVIISPDYHVLDLLRDNALFVNISDPYQLNLLPLLVTYGLSDFICDHGTQ